MGVIRSKEYYQSRSGNVDESGVVSLQRVFVVDTDSKTDTPVIAIAGLRYDDPDPAVPLGAVPIRVFDPHPHYKAATVRSCSCQPNGTSQTSWLITVNYSSAPMRAQQQGTGATALPTAASGSAITPSSDPSTGNNLAKPAPDRIPTWSYSVKTVEIPAESYTDASDGIKKPYVNLVGDPIEGLTVQRYNLMMTVNYYSNQMTDSEIADRIGKVNLSTYRGFPAGGVIVRDIKREDVYDFLGYDGVDEVFGLIWKVSIELEAVDAEKFWQTKVLHTGRRGRGTGGGPIVTFVDRQGERVADPLPLSSAGVCLRNPADAAPTAIDPSEFHYITFEDRLKMDFATLII